MIRPCPDCGVMVDTEPLLDLRAEPRTGLAWWCDCGGYGEEVDPPRAEVVRKELLIVQKAKLDQLDRMMRVQLAWFGAMGSNHPDAKQLAQSYQEEVRGLEILQERESQLGQELAELRLRGAA